MAPHSDGGGRATNPSAALGRTFGYEVEPLPDAGISRSRRSRARARGKVRVTKVSASQADGRGFDPRRPLHMNKPKPVSLGGFRCLNGLTRIYRLKPLKTGSLERIETTLGIHPVRPKAQVRLSG